MRKSLTARLNFQISFPNRLRASGGVAWIITTASDTGILSESPFMPVTAVSHWPRVSNFQAMLRKNPEIRKSHSGQVLFPPRDDQRSNDQFTFFRQDVSAQRGNIPGLSQENKIF
jgi:hypothetical protein